MIADFFYLNKIPAKILEPGGELGYVPKKSRTFLAFEYYLELLTVLELPDPAFFFLLILEKDQDQKGWEPL